MTDWREGGEFQQIPIEDPPPGEHPGKGPADRSGAPLPPMPPTYTEEWIAQADIKPSPFVIDGMYPVGLNLISAQPKIGKSWLQLAIGRAIAANELFCGSRKVRQGPVLLLDLEGNQLRVKKRSAIVRNGADPSPNLHFAHDWPPMDSGGLDLLEARIISAKLVAVGIDIWGMFRPARPKNADPYQFDHATAQQVSAMAQRTKCAIFAVHPT